MAAANAQMAELAVEASVSAEERNPPGSLGDAATEAASDEVGDSAEGISASSGFEQHSPWFYVHVNPLLGLYHSTLHDRSNWHLWGGRLHEVSKG